MVTPRFNSNEDRSSATLADATPGRADGSFARLHSAELWVRLAASDVLQRRMRPAQVGSCLVQHVSRIGRVQEH